MTLEAAEVIVVLEAVVVAGAIVVLEVVAAVVVVAAGGATGETIRVDSGWWLVASQGHFTASN